ncbi:MAG: hypothetical protein N2109_08860 [Fimbriimonadales bacterium]|nr:hypothetical protein [Fimbriimonadales bacterium]
MKLVLVLLALLALGGGVFFAAKRGLVRIPGITPAQRAANAQALYGESKDAKPSQAKAKEQPKAPKSPSEAPKRKPSAIPKPDLAKGRKRLAKLWEQLESPQLAAILADWRDDEAAAVLALMDPAKVAALLEQLEPKRASKLSREIQKAASMPAPGPAGP